MKEKYFYAEIDENNICCAVSELAGEVIADTMIRLAEYDESLLGKRYGDGVWEEVPQEPTPEPEQEPDVWDEMAAAISEGVNEV